MSGILDLDDYITEWAWKMFDAVKTKDEAKISKDQLQLQINWGRVRFQHGEPEYSDKQIPVEPKGQVIFTTTFVNDTEVEHEYSFKTERSTKSTCEIEVSKGVTTGASMELTLKTPCEVFELNGGFSREVAVSRSEGEIIEKELIWSVDSNIRLPSFTKTLASLVINQQEFDGRFKVKTKFWGRIIVSFHNRKDNNNFVRSVEGEMKDIFRSQDGFTVNGRIVSYISEGKCHFRFGVEQKVMLQQLPIDKSIDK
ncbi:uncharacterized protein [Watersipora subatra]|uniref:uncharacterized protein n=1 Tax=Watersipora subatra TaxID=2589382 RepID=UPI00355C023B